MAKIEGNQGGTAVATEPTPTVDKASLAASIKKALSYLKWAFLKGTRNVEVSPEKRKEAQADSQERAIIQQLFREFLAEHKEEIRTGLTEKDQNGKPYRVSASDVSAVMVKRFAAEFEARSAELMEKLRRNVTICAESMDRSVTLNGGVNAVDFVESYIGYREDRAVSNEKFLTAV